MIKGLAINRFAVSRVQLVPTGIVIRVDSVGNRIQGNFTGTNASGKTTVKGKLSSASRRTYLVQFYSNATGGNEGENFLGRKFVDASGSGSVTYASIPANKVGAGRTITATAADIITGDTSELPTKDGDILVVVPTQNRTWEVATGEGRTKPHRPSPGSYSADTWNVRRSRSSRDRPGDPAHLQRKIAEVPVATNANTIAVQTDRTVARSRDMNGSTKVESDTAGPPSEYVTLVEVLEMRVPHEEFEQAAQAALQRLEAEGVRELVNVRFHGSPESKEVSAILTFSDREAMLDHMEMVSSWEEFRRFFAMVRPLDVRVYGKLSAEADAWIGQFGEIVSRRYEKLIAGFVR